MLGLMQDWPLTLDRIMSHAAKWHGSQEIVTRHTAGVLQRLTYREVEQRARRLSSALESWNIRLGDRVGTLAMNGAGHLEWWYATMGIGAVCHTLNPRLADQDLAYIINKGEDRVIVVDDAFLPRVEMLRATCPCIEKIVVINRVSSEPLAPPVFAGEELIDTHAPSANWGGFDEKTAAGMCFTSGTTGRPKGVVYSHRSNFLHTLMVLQSDMHALSALDVVLPIVPMFHANAWGLAFSAPAVGAKLVMPGSLVDGASVAELIESEKVTFTGAVPTVLHSLLEHYISSNTRPTTLRRIITGGAPCPPALIRAFEDDFGIHVVHAWGMTELSPVGTVNMPVANTTQLSGDDRLKSKLKQGRPALGVDLRLIDDDGREISHDGESSGYLQVRGWAAAASYLGEEVSALDSEGFFDTGDIATIDPDGFMSITDRAKDLIKSGGEWISSQELERAASSCEGVEFAAAIGVPHAKWGERPLLIVSLTGAKTITADKLIEHLQSRVASWWVPESVTFIEAMPLNATGKVDKKLLRSKYLQNQDTQAVVGKKH